jgi:serine acetyltransferase
MLHKHPYCLNISKLKFIYVCIILLNCITILYFLIENTIQIIRVYMKYLLSIMLSINISRSSAH